VISKKSFYVVAMISGLKQAFKIDGSWIDHTKCVAADAQIHFVDIYAASGNLLRAAKFDNLESFEQS
jgi:hypothetical protein